MIDPLGAIEAVRVISAWIAGEAVLEESGDRRVPSDNVARGLAEMLAPTAEA
jgi:hypothetical protein